MPGESSSSGKKFDLPIRTKPKSSTGLDAERPKAAQGLLKARDKPRSVSEAKKNPKEKKPSPLGK